MARDEQLLKGIEDSIGSTEPGVWEEILAGLQGVADTAVSPAATMGAIVESMRGSPVDSEPDKYGVITKASNPRQRYRHLPAPVLDAIFPEYSDPEVAKAEEHASATKRKVDAMKATRMMRIADLVARSNAESSDVYSAVGNDIQRGDSADVGRVRQLESFIGKKGAGSGPLSKFKSASGDPTTERDSQSMLYVQLKRLGYSEEQINRILSSVQAGQIK